MPISVQERPIDRCQRRPGESAGAYKAYRVYRDLGPARTLAAAWRTHRQTSRKAANSRGRPRLAKAEARYPSGQWAAWSKRERWAERAAAYDDTVDAEKREARLKQIRELEQQCLQKELASQGLLEELVRRMEAILDQADSSAITGFTQWKREVVDKKVLEASKRQVHGLNLFSYADLVRLTNETARWAIVGFRDENEEDLDDRLAPEAVIENGGLARIRSVIGSAVDCNGALGSHRLPGESARAYRAFCVYRDQRPERSLAAAWMEDRQSVDRAAKAGGRRVAPARRSVGHWGAWSGQWSWEARAAAYDAIVATTRRQAQRYRMKIIAARRLDFEVENQERLENRFSKICALANRADDAPIVDVTQRVEWSEGKNIRKTKTHVEGLNLAGYAVLNKELLETGRQAVVGVDKTRKKPSSTELLPSANFSRPKRPLSPII